MDIKLIHDGDIFSEISHYSFIKREGKLNIFRHVESGNTVRLDDNYVKDLLKTANQFSQTVEVGKEDKKDGTPGIRSIWENIHSSQVFTVCFTKASKPLSKKVFEERRKQQIAAALEKIERAQRSKKGVLDAAKFELTDIQNNPIFDSEEGDDRILKGYKVQFISRDGRYNCVDMNYPDGPKEPNIRPVNINTIKWLVFDDIKYIVK